MYRTADNTYCGVFDSRVKKQYSTKTDDRIVEFFEIELFTEESGVSHINSAEYPVKRGMLLCAKPGEVRYSNLPVKCNFIRIKPGEDEIDGILSSLPDVTYIEDEAIYERILGSMRKLASCMLGPSDDSATSLKINSLFYDIVYTCMRETIGKNMSIKSENRLISEACGYIDENYTQNCTLAKVAESVHCSPNYLHSLFKRTSGITPYEYIMQKRINLAKRQIMAGEASLISIALSCGFCSQSHFNKVFRERVGVTPAQFRREIWEKY